MAEPTGTNTNTEHGTFPLDREEVARIVAAEGFDLRTASIREVNRLVNGIERRLGVRFVRMEFGIPGLALDPIAIEAETRALRDLQVGHVYAPFEGLPELKEEAARFVELFMDIRVPPSCCVPTVGAMEGCFAGLALAGRLRDERRTVLLLEPGFPVNKLQLRFLGLRREALDFYDHRGDRLISAVAKLAARGDICAILWSSPNNPSWIVLKESELQGLGRICDEHGILAIEDMAYFGMDVRQDYFKPRQPPYQPTVLRYTRHGICVISSSKLFSYAGQRIGIAVLSPELMEMEVPGLRESLGSSRVGHAFIHGVLYPIAACVPEGPQHGLLELLRAANGGNQRLFGAAKEYARRAAILKKSFLQNGFRLVYDNDLGEPLSDGFYFTVSYPGIDQGSDLLLELLHYGVSAITLESAGSCRREGLRICVSLADDRVIEMLAPRLAAFHRDHPAA